MKLNVNGLEESLQKAARGVNRVLKFDFSENGVPVAAKKIERGFTVKKTAGGWEIGYRKTTDFLRALLYMKCGGNAAQECCFDDLGMMVDCSRNAVPTVETVKQLASLLACMGYTYIYLYTEDTYELENNPYFGYLRGRYTKEEIREIDAFCADIGLELIPCIQTLAHLNQITRYSDYCDIIDCNDILLCDDERTYRLIDDMFATLEHVFTSRKVNIGMDEAHFLGLGKYLNEHGYVSKFEIMLRHLNRVLEIAQKHGFTSCSMWSDMFFRMASGGEYYKSFKKIPEELDGRIPENVNLVYWDYYSTDYSHFAEMLDSHLLLSDKIEFAGGAWKWVGWTPINAFSLGLASASVRACRDKGVKNYFVTAWGDNGAEAGLFSVLPSLYYLAQCAYGDEKNSLPFQKLTGVCFDDFMKLDLPNRANEKQATQRNNSSKFFLYDDLLLGIFDSLIEEGQTAYYARFAKELSGVKAGEYRYLFRELSDLCSVLECKTDLALKLKKAYAAQDKNALNALSGDFKELLRRISKFYRSFAAAWNAENKPFGFEVQDQRLGGLISRVKAVVKRIEEFAAGKTDCIPELDEKHLPYGCYAAEKDFSNLFYNDWAGIVSPSKM